MFIAYKPELSFYATVHWEMHGSEPAFHGLSATFVDEAPTSLDNGWIYASVGDTYSGLKPVGLGLDWVAGRLVGLKFWFACYYFEDETAYRYRYKIIAYDDRQSSNPFQRYLLDVSRNGYLAVYKPSNLGRSADEAPLWELSGLDPWALQDDMAVSNVTLISPAGKPVRRLMEDNFPYLNDQTGHDTRFTIKVAEDARRRPW